MDKPVTVIGAGLSGCEAALQLARRGLAVELWEQRPDVKTPAHETGHLAELVCSNSLKSTDPARAQGLLKQELDRLGCRLLAIARENEVPGGAALCVDREGFSAAVTAAIEAEPLITLRREQCRGLAGVLQASSAVVVATGPLTADELWSDLVSITGAEHSYFFDATSPIISAGSVDMEVAFAQSRYDKGGGEDYINCPFDREQYGSFLEALVSADQVPLGTTEDYRLFEGCLPIEELAQRGRDTMRFGPLKPKGINDPRTGREPHAVVQLRWEDALRNSLNIVGFQTRLRISEQERVFRMIPGLTDARFLRHGRMHRNSYLNAPRVLLPTLQLAADPRVIVTGQLTGLEGYMAAISTGLWAGINAACIARDRQPVVPPEQSCLGAMLRFMVSPDHKDYRPTAFQYGMLTWLPERIRKQAKQELIVMSAHQAWDEMKGWPEIAG